MLRALVRFLRTIPLFVYWPLRYFINAPNWQTLRQLCVVWGLLPFFLFLQFSHWLGFLIDELCFRQYRLIKVQSPIFVTGIPRSGTTHLQRVLAGHTELSSMVLWECLFAPSISERMFYRSLTQLSQRVARCLKPMARLPGIRDAVAGFERLFTCIDHIHTLGLNEAEEDFVALMSVNACFLLVLLFPQQSWYWQLTRFDDAVNASERDTILCFYKRLIQKHLYFHDGALQTSGLRYLSKNPSFLPWLNSLRQYFPGARFILCEREPAMAVASQLSALRPAWRFLQGGAMSERFVWQLVKMLGEFYHRLDRELNLARAQYTQHNIKLQNSYQNSHQSRDHDHTGNDDEARNHHDALVVPFDGLKEALSATITQIIQFAQLPMNEAFTDYLQQVTQASRTYRSAHQYDLSEFSLDWSGLESLFPRRFSAQAPGTGAVL